MEKSPKSQENQSPSLKLQEKQNPYPRFQDTPQNPPLIPSPSSSSSSNGVNNAPPTPTTPRSITRSEPNNPYPTTFVQADSSSFKQVVQMLTGSSETVTRASSNKPEPAKNPIPPIRNGPKRQPSSKLYERRNSLKNFKISPLVPGFVSNTGVSPRKLGPPEILSPSVLDFPSLALSPVTPLIPDPFNRSPNARPLPSLDMAAEDQAISKKGFYLHPSPRANTPRDPEPRLLPLFPVTSPRVSGSSPSS